MDKPTLFTVAPKFIDQAWKDGASRLSEACDKAAGEVTTDQLKMLLARGERTLLGLRDGDGPPMAWVAVSIMQLPNIRTLYVYAIWAPGATGVECMGQLRSFARAEGCSAIRGACNDAVQRLWERKFAARKIYSIIEIEV